MISKHTKVLLLVAVTSIGIAAGWQYYSHVTYEKSPHPPELYNLDARTGMLTSSKPDNTPLLVRVLRSVGMVTLLLTIPLLVNDITHRRQRGE